MSVIFDSAGGVNNRGRVIAMLPSNEVAAGLLQLGDWPDFVQVKSIITRMSVSRGVSYQLQHTLGERIYLYVFGDRAGQMNLSGIAFDSICGSKDERRGISHVIDYYQKAKLSKRDRPLTVTIDSSTVFEAYLHTMHGEAFSLSGTIERMFQFHLELVIPPNPGTAGQK